MPAQLGRDAQDPAQQPQDRIALHIRHLVAQQQHLDAGGDQEHGKDVEQPAELGDQGRPQPDHDGAQHDHAQDAPEQDPVLVERRNGEESEDQRDEEDIVHRQRLLDQEAREVLLAALRAQLVPDPAAEDQGDGDVEAAHPEAFAHPDLAHLAMEHAEVEDEQRCHDAQEDGPHPYRLAHRRTAQKFHRISPLIVRPPMAARDSVGPVSGACGRETSLEGAAASMRRAGPSGGP